MRLRMKPEVTPMLELNADYKMGQRERIDAIQERTRKPER